MRSYDIWNEVTGHDYASSRDWGANERCTTLVCVGSGARASQPFVGLSTRRSPVPGSRLVQFGAFLTVYSPHIAAQQTQRLPVARMMFDPQTGRFSPSITLVSPLNLQEQLI